MDEKFYKEIGRKIKELRKKKKITQEELAFKIGKSPNFIGLIERGKKRPSIETLRKIAEVLDVPIKSFFESFNYSPPQEDILTEKIKMLLRDTSDKDKKAIYQIIRTIIERKKG